MRWRCFGAGIAFPERVVQRGRLAIVVVERIRLALHGDAIVDVHCVVLWVVAGRGTPDTGHRTDINKKNKPQVSPNILGKASLCL